MPVDHISMSYEVKVLTNDGLDGIYYWTDSGLEHRCEDMSGIIADILFNVLDAFGEEAQP